MQATGARLSACKASPRVPPRYSSWKMHVSLRTRGLVEYSYLAFGASGAASLLCRVAVAVGRQVGLGLGRLRLKRASKLSLLHARPMSRSSPCRYVSESTSKPLVPYICVGRCLASGGSACLPANPQPDPNASPSPPKPPSPFSLLLPWSWPGGTPLRPAACGEGSCWRGREHEREL